MRRLYTGGTMIRKQLLLALILLVAIPALAHHSITLYDMKNPITVKGTVTRIEWANPHAYLFIDVTNDKGEIEEWTIELNSPNLLKRNGWTNTSVKPGDGVTCMGGPAKTGARSLRATTVGLADGRQMKS
jgi:hypothetical protein